MRRVTIAAIGSLSLCVGVVVHAEEQPSRALTTANLLAGADRAAGGDRSSREQLAAKLRVLDRLGAHAINGTGDDPLREWRKTAGFDEPDYRGRVLGPAFRHGWIGPGESAAIEQQFLGGQRTTVAIAATPDGALDLRVDDPATGAVCRAERHSCSWLPLYTQRYTINVRNPGREKVRFYLVVD